MPDYYTVQDWGLTDPPKTIEDVFKYHADTQLPIKIGVNYYWIGSDSPMVEGAIHSSYLRGVDHGKQEIVREIKRLLGLL